MTLYVRSKVFNGDNYTVYWDTARHEWGPLSLAGVYTQEQIDSLSNVPGSNQQFIMNKATGWKVYVPEGEWEGLPEQLTLGN